MKNAALQAGRNSGLRVYTPRGSTPSGSNDRGLGPGPRATGAPKPEARRLGVMSSILKVVEVGS